MNNFFDQDFQLQLAKAQWNFPSFSDEDFQRIETNFEGWKTFLVYDKAVQDELGYCSMSRTYKDRFVNSHIRVETRVNGNENFVLKIEPVGSSSLGSSRIASPGILFESWANGGFINLDQNDRSIESKRMLTRPEQLLSGEWSVEYKPSIDNSVVFSLVPRMIYKDGEEEINSPNSIFEKSRIGWGAIDAEKIAENRLRVFVTDLVDEIDFNSLVFDLIFPRPISELSVGFHDIPEFFSKS